MTSRPIFCCLLYSTKSTAITKVKRIFLQENAKTYLFFYILFFIVSHILIDKIRKNSLSPDNQTRLLPCFFSECKNPHAYIWDNIRTVLLQ